MKQERVKLLLQFLGTKQTGIRAGEWIESPCPLKWRHGGRDVHPSFGIKVSKTHKSICKCWSCGFGGDLQDLVMEIGFHLKKHPDNGYRIKEAMQLVATEAEDMDINPEDIPDFDQVPVSDEVIFPEYWLDSFKSVVTYPVAMQYLHSRGVTDKVIEQMDVRYDPLQKRVGFPFRNFKGELVGLQGRSIDPNSNLRYYQYGYDGKRNGRNWLGENTVDFDKPVVLVEGPLDMASILRVYPNVMASFTSGLSVEKMKRISDASEIITFYDYGNGGNAARTALKKRLGKVPMVHIIPTEEEDDAGAMTEDQVRHYLQDHVNLT